MAGTSTSQESPLPLQESPLHLSPCLAGVASTRGRPDSELGANCRAAPGGGVLDAEAGLLPALLQDLHDRHRVPDGVLPEPVHVTSAESNLEAAASGICHLLRLYPWLCLVARWPGKTLGQRPLGSKPSRSRVESRLRPPPRMPTRRWKGPSMCRRLPFLRASWAGGARGWGQGARRGTCCEEEAQARHGEGPTGVRDRVMMRAGLLPE